jgi:uncharacterized protein (DUF488 family)
MIYTIGHGTKRVEDFIEELKSFGVSYLIDVRSSPFSKFNPQFNQGSIKHDLKSAEIVYVYLGDKLGGLPNDRSCYIEGKVDYDIMKDKDFFKEGLERLITANNKKINIAVMCSESKPEECHRSKLIGQELLKRNISILHIVGLSRAKTQVDVINELNKGRNVVDLFNSEQNFTSRKKYE